MDIMNDTFLEQDALDEVYEIPQEYNLRPDLASYKLWALQNIGGFLQRET